MSAPDSGDAEGDERTILFDARGQRRDGATVVVERPEGGAAAERCKLVVVTGSRQGKEYPLHGTEVNVGRDERNDIVIPDISVSRRHARLRREANAWTVGTLPDGGVVRVNGLKVEDQALASGDLVEIGRIELQFVEADTSSVVWLQRRKSQSNELTKASVRPPPRPVNRRIRRVAIGCLAAVSFSMLLRAVLNTGKTERIDVVVSSDQRPVEELFATAREEVLAQNWSEALELLRRAAARAPDDEQIRHTLEVVVQESKNQEHLDAAMKALAASDLKRAQAELDAISAGTLMAEKLGQARSKLQVLQRKQIETSRAQVEAQARTAQAGPGPAPSPRPEPAAGGDALAKARALFGSGDLGGATAAAAGVATPEGDSLKSNMLRSDQLLQQGLAALGKSEYGSAARLFDQSGALARSIRPGSPIERKARQSAANAWVQVGTEALASNDQRKAREAFDGAALADPTNDAAKAELAKLDDLAQRLFQEGYTTRTDDPDLARRKFQGVLNLTPATSPLHHAADVWMQKLAKSGGAR